MRYYDLMQLDSIVHGVYLPSPLRCNTSCLLETCSLKHGDNPFVINRVIYKASFKALEEGCVDRLTDE